MHKVYLPTAGDGALFSDACAFSTSAALLVLDLVLALGADDGALLLVEVGAGMLVVVLGFSTASVLFCLATARPTGFSGSSAGLVGLPLPLVCAAAGSFVAAVFAGGFGEGSLLAGFASLAFAAAAVLLEDLPSVAGGSFAF